MVCDIVDVVNQMMEKRGVRKYEIDIEGQSEVVDGYLGEIVFFGVTENSQVKYNFVLKSGKTDEKLKEILSAEKIYNREHYMYSTLFPTLEQFLEQKYLNGFMNFIPKAWFTSGTEDREFIILENLKYRNYDMCDRKKPMDLTHMKLVFENYGRWHGLTMAFKDQNPEKFSEVENNLGEDLKPMMQEKFGLFDNYRKEYQIILKMLQDCGRKDLADIYRGIENRIEIVMRRNVPKKDFVCITHGDCWITNYMFKYKKSSCSIPEEMCLIDFQLSAFDSPVVDLSTLFYNVGNSETFEDFEHILDIYFESLKATIQSLGSNPDKLFTMSDLKRHWKDHAFYGLISSIIFMKLELLDLDEAPNISKIIENGGTLQECFSFEIRNMESVRQRLLKNFIHYGEFLKH